MSWWMVVQALSTTVTFAIASLIVAFFVRSHRLQKEFEARFGEPSNGRGPRKMVPRPIQRRLHDDLSARVDAQDDQIAALDRRLTEMNGVVMRMLADLSRGEGTRG